MKKTDSKKLDQIIAMIGDVIEIFGKRFDKMDDEIAGVKKEIRVVKDEVVAVKGKVTGIDSRLDLEADRRTDLKLPRRMHNVEVKVFGDSRHPKSLPF